MNLQMFVSKPTMKNLNNGLGGRNMMVGVGGEAFCHNPKYQNVGFDIEEVKKKLNVRIFPFGMDLVVHILLKLTDVRGRSCVYNQKWK